MISILIPTYNYNISSLVSEIHKQATTANIPFEIICFDDKSEKYVLENKTTIDSLPNAKIITSKYNLGRTEARQKLCNESIYNWLLFLDADVMPKDDCFFQNYAEQIKSVNDAIYGGITYLNEKPKNEFILRWKYGRTYEDIPARNRNHKPYQVITSGCFLIRKAIFFKINSQIDRKSYGLDNYFASLLKQNNIKVLHINNEVYHNGLESSMTYVKKSEECIITLLWLYNKKKMLKHDNKLLSLFVLLKKFKLNYLMLLFYNIFNSAIKKNLVSPEPNLYLLQIYKLSYICYKDLKS
jgi:glycosyltransferase involved in cell wall biosynthesis